MVNKNRITVLVLLFSLMFFKLTNAASLIDTNWDGATTPTGWPCKNTSTSCSTNLSFLGWTAPVADYCTEFSWWSQTGISSANAHSGTNSFYSYRAPGEAASCDIKHTLTQPYPTKVYIRFYLYLNKDFINFNTPTTREPSYHLMFTNSAFSQTGLRVNLLTKVPWTTNYTCGATKISPNRPYAFFSIQDYSREWPVGTYPNGCYNLLDHLGQWQCTEFMMDAASDTVTIWVDGTKVYTATDRITQTDFTMIQFSNYMSTEGGSGFSTSYYIDDIVVSDQPVGCSSGIRPNPPVLHEPLDVL